MRRGSPATWRLSFTQGRQERLERLDGAYDLSSLSGEVEAVGRGNRSMQRCPPDSRLRSRAARPRGSPCGQAARSSPLSCSPISRSPAAARRARPGPLPARHARHAHRPRRSRRDDSDTDHQQPVFDGSADLRGCTLRRDTRLGDRPPTAPGVQLRGVVPGPCRPARLLRPGGVRHQRSRGRRLLRPLRRCGERGRLRDSPPRVRGSCARGRRARACAGPRRR